MTKKRNVTERKNFFNLTELAYIKRLADRELKEIEGLETTDKKYKERQSILRQIIKKVRYYKEGVK